MFFIGGSLNNNIFSCIVSDKCEKWGNIFKKIFHLLFRETPI